MPRRTQKRDHKRHRYPSLDLTLPPDLKTIPLFHSQNTSQTVEVPSVSYKEGSKWVSLHFTDHHTPEKELKIKRQKIMSRRKDTCGQSFHRPFSKTLNKTPVLRSTNRRYVPLQIMVGSLGSSKHCSPSVSSSEHFGDVVIMPEPPMIVSPIVDNQVQHSSATQEDRGWTDTNFKDSLGTINFVDDVGTKQCYKRRSYFRNPSAERQHRVEESAILAPDTPEREYGLTIKMRQLEELKRNLFQCR